MCHHRTADGKSDDRVPRQGATTGRESLATRLAAKGSRLFRSPHRHATANVDASPVAVPWRLRQRVLADYHATNLAAARASSEELVRAGFHTGEVPYGYRARRVRVTPPGRRPRWRTRLVIEPVEAATVRMIFTWRGEDQLSPAHIQRRLAASRYPAPVNPCSGQPGVWSVATVRAILRNPKYLGHQVWGRTHHGKRTSPARWVWSPANAHPPVISTELFAAANQHATPAVPPERTAP